MTGTNDDTLPVGDASLDRSAPDLSGVFPEPFEHDLRVTSDIFLTRVVRLHGLEERKRELPSSQMVEMAREVESLTAEILDWARKQTRLAETAARPDTAARPIAMIPPRAANVVLQEWRAAERALTAMEPATAEFEARRADVERLRDEYARAYYLQTRANQQ